MFKKLFPYLVILLLLLVAGLLAYAADWVVAHKWTRVAALTAIIVGRWLGVHHSDEWQTLWSSLKDLK